MKKGILVILSVLFLGCTTIPSGYIDPYTPVGTDIKIFIQQYDQKPVSVTVDKNTGNAYIKYRAETYDGLVEYIVVFDKEGKLKGIYVAKHDGNSVKNELFTTQTDLSARKSVQ